MSKEKLDFTCSSSIAPIALDLGGKRGIQVRTDKPALFVFGDQSMPESLQDSHTAVGVVHIEDATFKALEDEIRYIFECKATWVGGRKAGPS